jgi:plasmid rolling circle replication initiator protein Rep
MIPNSIVTPSRFYEYLGARKPIIFSSPESELTRIAESTKAAIITKHNDVLELKNALYQYYKAWKSSSLPIPDENVVDKFDRKLLTQQLSKELALCVKYRPV